MPLARRLREGGVNRPKALQRQAFLPLPPLRGEVAHTRNRHAPPSATTRPAVGALKCVPITSVSVPAKSPNIRARVAVEAADRKSVG